ncbi:MAG TPA: tetratricopeptide repeat protein [Opitutaceae bacterium]|nr:tetratricopeptide repeat protein [Opitutaceae bacterium]
MKAGEPVPEPARASVGATPARRPRRPVALAAMVIILAALAACQSSFRVPFVFDDFSSIVRNTSLQHLWPPWRLFAGNEGLTVSGRPVLSFSLALNYALSGTAVWSYHATNLAIHALAALTLFGLVRRTLPRPVCGNLFAGDAGRRQSNAGLVALASALLWMLHPLQTEAVTYVVQRAESLMGLFYLLTLYGFLRATESPRPRRWQGFAVLACLLGMGTKEVMVTAPILVLLYDRTFVAGSFREAWRQRRTFYGGLAATWIPLVLLVAGTGGNRGGAFAFNLGAAKSYWLSQCEALTRYLGLSLWPHPLVFEYGPFWVHDAAQVLPYAIVVVGLAGAVLVTLWRWPAIGFLGGWFFAILAPTSLTPGTTEMIVEHRMYLPLAAVVVLLVAGLYRWAGRAGLAASVALALACGWLTTARNRDYRSELALWADTVAKRPGNGLAHLNYGATLFEAGRYAEARDQFERALKTGPDDAETEANLGAALLRLGRAAEAEDRFARARQLDPRYGKAVYGLGLARFAEDHWEAAIEPLRQAARERPNDAELENDLGMALARTGRVQEAIEHYEAAIRVAPAGAEAEYNLGSLWLSLGRTSDAIDHLERAVRLRPAQPDMLNNLAGALLGAGRMPEAIAHYEAALRVAPGRADLHYNFGLALAKAGRLDEAIVCFREAIRLQPDSAEGHLGLAHALAQAGRAAEAEAERAAGLRLQAERSSEHH